MPPLHRMPIAYLAAAVVAVAWATSAAARRPAAAPAHEAAIGREIPSPRPAPTRVAPPPDRILRTPEGLRRKVLVAALDASARPDGRDARAVPLDYLSIHFLTGERPGALEVGPAGGPPIGWVDAASVVEWDTRLMARPTRAKGRPPLVLYRDRGCLLDALAGRSCPRHGASCPTEGEDVPRDGAGPAPALGLPILSTESIPQPDGSGRVIHEVASPVRDRAPLARPSEPPPDLRPLLQTVYLAVAIDTTASMGSAIDAARGFAADLVAQARDRYRDVTLRLALVEYRDHAPEFGFAVRIAQPFADPARFLEALGQLKAARSGDGSVEERVLDGVEAALPASPDGSPGLPHLAWPSGRAGDLTTKMLVLIGDAPDRDPDASRAQALAARAKAAGIAIATVRIDRPGALSRAEAAKYRDQWHALASGSHLARDRETGFASTISPIEVALGDGEALAPRLRAMLDDRVDRARDLAALAAAEAEGRLVEYTNRHGIPIDALLPVLNDLHRGEPTPSSRPDPRFNGRKAPSVRRGWIAERAGGQPLVELEVLMSRPELDALIDELRTLDQATVGSAAELDDLLRIGRAAIAGEGAFLAADRGDRTFADHLRARQGLPPARPDSLLRRTQTDLLQADDATRAALDARLRTALVRLIERRNAPDWDDPTRTADGMAAVPYSWLDW